LLSRLPQIAVPTLFVTGGADRAVPPSVSREAAARMPGAEVVEIAGLGHLMHEEDAARVAALLDQFLRKQL
jgi:magnesium chelatase accessory protein